MAKEDVDALVDRLRSDIASLQDELRQCRAARAALVERERSLAPALPAADAASIWLVAIVQSSLDAIIGKSLDGRITSWNPAAERMFGYTADEAIGEFVTIIIPPDRVDEEADILSRLAQGLVVPMFETVRRTRDGRLVDVSITVSPIRDAQGRTVGASKIARDITHMRAAQDALRDARVLIEAERLARQQELENSLREKDVLLKEIHHRVKNNMQVISSLLQLQMGAQKSDAIRHAFEDSQGRIRSMALVHEKLYKSRDMARIDFGSYVRDLVAGVAASLRRYAGNVVVDVEADALQLDVDSAISCGLVVNELISNCFKHAFPAGRSGTIRVRLTGGPAHPTAISVQDDGVGWPPEFQPDQQASLGLRLVHLLADQLHATLRFTGAPGALCVLTLPAQP